MAVIRYRRCLDLAVRINSSPLAFVLRSGSLKEMAKLYGVSYPTVRNLADQPGTAVSPAGAAP